MIIEDIKLKLTLTLYKGKQRLRRWWPQVLENMTEIQTAHNALAEKVTEENDKLAQAIKDEAAIRERMDDVIIANVSDAASEIIKEKAAREAADSDLSGRLAAETVERERTLNVLSGNLVDIAAALTAEKAGREEADAAFDERVTSLEDIAHTHENKEILDAITDERVRKWDSIESQVTQEQLDAVNDSLEDIAFGHEHEFHQLYIALGVEHYNGSLFGTPYDDDDLDGGNFDSEPENTIDFGDFEPMIIVIPSGQTTAIIDGGDFTNTDGEIIDGGQY